MTTSNFRWLLVGACLSGLLFAGWTGHAQMQNNAPVTSAQQDEAQRKAISLARRRAKLEKWKASFLTYSIPFSPELLASENWREELASTFESMPQLRETRTTGTYLAGIYIADTLILPEKTKIVGDVFILANHIVFEVPNLEVGGWERDIYMCPIKSDSERRSH